MNQAKGYRIVNIDEVNHVEDTFKSIEPLRELEVIDGIMMMLLKNEFL